MDGEGNAMGWSASDWHILLILIAVIVLISLFGWCCSCICAEDDQADQPAESPEQRVARAWAEREASAARAVAVLAARAEVALTGQAAPAPPVLLPLPYFPYAAAHAQGAGKPLSETVECAICLEPLRPGQLCSEVPTCRHVFHSGCLGEWARSNGSCPLCRAKIVPGSDDEVAIADDMV